jgi:hypothetical protein
VLPEIVRALNPRGADYSGPDGADLFASDVALAGGLTVPRQGLATWLAGHPEGWERVEAIEAQEEAHRGALALAVGALGQVAIVLPSRLGGDLYVAQGGPWAFHRRALDVAFGLEVPSFYVAE